MKARTIIGILLIVAGVWKLANMWGLIENDWLWSQPWTAYVAPALLLYVGEKTIVNSYRRDPDQWLQRPLPIGGVGNGATRNAAPQAPTIHIVASNFCGGVDIKN